MRLINPSPGELLDRKTILHLKIEAGRQRQMDIVHFQKELDLIEAALADWLGKNVGADRRAYDEATQELADVNRKLWQAEDEVRQLPRNERDRLADLAKLIPELNDRRADLVQRVNRLFRVSHAEKMYR
ncbi:MAG: hypothetical protein HY656_00020 [Acidobacteria bacterium]|nr:hypothetical protein [Acidobacteriota bacterium]